MPAEVPAGGEAVPAGGEAGTAAGGGQASHRVVATAGHVDHGKSSLIVRLTGIDPDRWDEEKRRGLTIDLGYAWCGLPSGREVGFVDVPGHQRFIRNMLAGVGPAPLVMFVVAADEGWKPQSEEHLGILDALGVAGGIVALTKRDLVDDETLAIAAEEIRERMEGTTLAGVPVVPVSSTTGQGLDEIRDALDAMLTAAPASPPGAARLFVDRVFSIKGAGTVATGTLVGDCIAVGDELAIEPGDRRTRVRSLQTHSRAEDRACPVSRVAANLVGVERTDLERGDVLTRPGAWSPTSTFDVELRGVRGLTKPLTSRGAFKTYAGAAEADARVRFLGGNRLEPGAAAFARLRTSRPLALAVGDRVVLRDAGRRETVAGGVVVDLAPGKARDAPDRLAARAAAPPGALPALLLHERGAVAASEMPRLVGAEADPITVEGGWAVDPDLRARVDRALEDELAAFHEREPLASGAPIGEVRSVVARSLREVGAPTDRALLDALVDALAASGAVERSSTTVRLAGHRVALDEHDPDVRRLVAAIGGEHEATPPTVAELERSGVGRDVVEAAADAGLVTRISSDLVVTPELVTRAEALVRAAPDGITVSAFREALGTSRKYALPLLEHFDRTGVSRRDRNLRFPR
ncbi:MAG: selenocysteine-specific translation elongation factor [Actinomycetota bacterium]